MLSRRTLVTISLLMMVMTKLLDESETRLILTNSKNTPLSAYFASIIKFDSLFWLELGGTVQWDYCKGKTSTWPKVDFNLSPTRFGSTISTVSRRIRRWIVFYVAFLLNFEPWCWNLSKFRDIIFAFSTIFYLSILRQNFNVVRMNRLCQYGWF